jgi:hypothetical protein
VRVKAIGRRQPRNCSSSPAVRAIASLILPPPKWAGSAKPTWKSTMSSAGRRPKPLLFP